MKEKIKELFDSIKLKTVLIKNFPTHLDSNFFYFTQLKEKGFENNFLILKPNKKPLVLCSILEYGNLVKEKQLKVKKYSTEKELNKILRKEFKGAKEIGFNESIYPIGLMKKLKKSFKTKKFVGISNQLSSLRETKTKKELNKIKKSVELTEKILKKVPKLFRKNMSEKKLAFLLEYEAKKKRAEDLAFPTIVASGKNACIPHYITSNKKIKKNSFLLIDFGIKLNGYCSDLSRTFFVGKANQKHKEIYSAVFKAQQAALLKVKEGVNGKEVFNAANEVIKKEFKQKMIHSVGHGLGLLVHDFPERMKIKAGWKLKKNMVLTIEPGFYNKKIGGIRIEDDIIVTKDGFKKLSQAPKKLIELK